MGRKASANPKRITSFYLPSVSKLIMEYLKNKWGYSSNSQVMEQALNIAFAQNFKDTRNTPDDVLNDQKEKLENSITEAIDALEKIQDHQENTILLEKIKVELNRVKITPNHEVHYAKCVKCSFKKKLKDPAIQIVGARCPKCKGLIVREVKEVPIPIDWK